MRVQEEKRKSPGITIEPREHRERNKRSRRIRKREREGNLQPKLTDLAEPTHPQLFTFPLSPLSDSQFNFPEIGSGTVDAYQM